MNGDRPVLPILEHSTSVIIAIPYGAAVIDLLAPQWASSFIVLRSPIVMIPTHSPHRSYSNASSESTMMATTPLEYLEERRIKDLVKKHSDMNAGLGSFAVAIQSPKLWVMNVVPTIAEKSVKPFQHTYPRTYDLIHANGLFSLYKDK
ncbi:putative methyltransferase [Arachis hypogaea]|nr:putative methyltransferase [Arachis hypogaea]